MTDLESLAVLAVALYGSECLLWLRHGHVAFRRLPLARRHRPIRPSTVFGNDRCGLVLTSPVPPLGRTFVCGDWLLTLNADSVGCLAPWARTPDARMARLDAIREVTHDKGRVLIDGATLLDAGEHAAAGHCAELIRALARLGRKERETAIDSELRRATNVPGIRRIVKSFLHRTALLRFCCHILFLLVVLVLPAMAWHYELTAFWPQYLMLMSSALVFALVLFLILHKRMYPDAADAKWQQFATMLLAPTMAARAADKLSRPLLARFHPLAVAAALSDKATFRAIARRTMLDLRCPAISRDKIDQAQARLEFEFRPRLATALAAMIVREGWDVAELTAPPMPDDPASQTYCPRCDRQFALPEGTCRDCGGIALVRFPPALRASDQPRAAATEDLSLTKRET